MAEIDIGPLQDRLSDEEIAELGKKLDKLAAGKLPAGDEKSLQFAGEEVDDDALAELLDRLDAYDSAAEIYVPLEFNGQVDIGDLRVGSLLALLDASEELTEDLEEEDDEDEDDEDDDEDDDDEEEDEDEEEEEDAPYGGRRSTARVLKALRTLANVAQIALDKKLPLHIRS